MIKIGGILSETYGCELSIILSIELLPNSQRGSELVGVSILGTTSELVLWTLNQVRIEFTITELIVQPLSVSSPEGSP